MADKTNVPSSLIVLYLEGAVRKMMSPLVYACICICVCVCVCVYVCMRVSHTHVYAPHRVGVHFLWPIINANCKT